MEKNVTIKPVKIKTIHSCPPADVQNKTMSHLRFVAELKSAVLFRRVLNRLIIKVNLL